MASCPICGDYRIPSAATCKCGYEYQLPYEAAENGSDVISVQNERLGSTSEITISGWLLVAIGAVLTFLAINFRTTITTTVPYGDGVLSGITRSSEVQNIGLLQQQMMIFQGGALLILAGVLCIAIGAALTALKPIRPLS